MTLLVHRGVFGAVNEPFAVFGAVNEPFFLLYGGTILG